MGRRSAAWVVDLLIYLLLMSLLGPTPISPLAEYHEIPSGFNGDACTVVTNADSDVGPCLTIGDRVYFTDQSEAVVQFLVALAWFLLIYGVLQGTKGVTPGKALFGVTVVDEHGRPPGVGRSLLRSLLWIIDGLPCIPLVGFICALTSTGHRRVGDMVAKTFVVGKASAGRPVIVPGLTTTYSAGYGAPGYGQPGGWGGPPSGGYPAPGQPGQPAQPGAWGAAPTAPPTAAGPWTAPGASGPYAAPGSSPTSGGYAPPAGDARPAPPAGAGASGPPSGESPAPSPPGGSPAARPMPAARPTPAATPEPEPGAGAPGPAATTPGTPSGESPAASPAAGTRSPSSGAATGAAGGSGYNPQWDAARNTYIVWEPNQGRWLGWDDTTKEWRPL
jgi:uncharacterized RDD family membrane protein YckC